MWKIINYFLGFVRLQILSARPTWLLQQFADASVAMREISIKDQEVIKLTIRKSDLHIVKKILQKTNSELISGKPGGFFYDFRAVFARPLILASVLLAILCGIVIPKFVWFYSVEGNETVPSELILRELRELGVGFGTFGPSIHPQELKNKMLRRIPKLSWFTVQQYGGRAVVIVRERPEILPVLDRKTPMDLVAIRTGIVTKIETYQGNPLCKVGDCVLKGQTLVSAYKKLDYSTEVSTAIAEVYAKTRHKYRLVCPAEVLEKTKKRTKRYISLVVGRKRLNFFFGSSICGINCDKIIKSYPFVLPGGYKLPIGIEIAIKTDYDTQKQAIDPISAKLMLQSTAYDYTASQLIAGTVLSQNEPGEGDLRQYCYYAVLDCEEMIGRLQSAKELKDELTDDRTNN